MISCPKCNREIKLSKELKKSNGSIFCKNCNSKFVESKFTKIFTSLLATCPIIIYFFFEKQANNFLSIFTTNNQLKSIVFAIIATLWASSIYKTSHIWAKYIEL